MNRRFALPLSALLLLVTACQDLQQPTADFQVSDGSAFGGNGNPHFYFLPPIVPSPSYTGVFDPSVLPYLSVRVFGPFDNDGLAECGGNLVAEFNGASGLAVDGDRFAYGWNTPKSLKRDKVYRLCVMLEVPGVVLDTLGFRDISPTQGGGSVAEDPVYLFNTGSNLAIKFRVEVGALSDALCTTGVLGDDYDCTAQFLNSNQSALCDNATCLLTTGIMDTPELFLVEKFGVDNPRCFEDEGTSTVAGFPLAVDIPQYAGCVRITIFDEDLSFQGFLDSYGTVGACFYPGSGPPVKASQQQDEAIQMHIQYPDPQPDGDPTVWALPWGSTGGIVEACDLVETQGGGNLAAAARKLWRGAQRMLNPWFAPPMVYAFHTGFGGHTSLRSTEGPLQAPPDASPLVDGAALSADLSAVEPEVALQANMSETEKVFRLAWALPSQMAATTFCGGTGCSGVATQPLTVNLGVPVTLTLRVTDNGAVANTTAPGGRSLGTPRGVEGARVRFADSDGGADVRTSDNGGYVSYAFTPEDRGLASISVAGFGMGTSAGPYDAFVNGTYVNQASLLDLGQLTFNIRVCQPGPAVNGLVEANDGYPSAPAGWNAVPVNLGGNLTGTAYLHVTNDCDHLYLTLLMPSDNSKENSLRLVFAQDGDPAGGISEGPFDDILSLSPTGFGDRYLSQSCVGSKQSDCGPSDPDRPADGAGVAAYQTFAVPFLGQSSWYVYEMKHPLAAGGSPYDVNLVPGRTVYYYGAVSLGGGSKGNTEFPDQKGNFKNYGYSYTVK